jgi:riboflavin biosynthesis pyrimidine reductase
MKRIRFSAAVSLDGYIAGPNGEADWIVPDPEWDFPALIAQFDTLLVGPPDVRDDGSREANDHAWHAHRRPVDHVAPSRLSGGDHR